MFHVEHSQRTLRVKHTFHVEYENYKYRNYVPRGTFLETHIIVINVSIVPRGTILITQRKGYGRRSLKRRALRRDS